MNTIMYLNYVILYALTERNVECGHNYGVFFSYNLEMSGFLVALITCFDSMCV